MDGWMDGPWLKEHDVRRSGSGMKSVFEAVWACVELDFRAALSITGGDDQREALEAAHELFMMNPRAPEIAELFYHGEGNVDLITSASFRRLCYMSERQGS